jgi:putative membrane protein
MSRRTFPICAAGIAVLAHSTIVFGHEGLPPQPHDLWTAWSLEPVVLIGLFLTGGLYWRGLRRMANQRLLGGTSLAFWGGWLALVLALVSPLDALGNALFAGHMIQHEVLMLMAAPLLVLGRPLAPWLLSLPVKWRRKLTNLGKTAWLQRGWRWLVNPVMAWLIHAWILWVWHAPVLFQWTLKNEFVHATQHMSFLLSALLFCEALVYGLDRHMGYGAAVIYVFTTAIHTSILGALLTFSSTLWYPAYQETTMAWGLTPLEDQQLGGLIMWVPAGIVYLVAGLLLFAFWLRAAERQALS